jgi:hypothetical protein
VIIFHGTINYGLLGKFHRLLLSLLVWPRVITLRDFYCIIISSYNKKFDNNNSCSSSCKSMSPVIGPTPERLRRSARGTGRHWRRRRPVSSTKSGFQIRHVFIHEFGHAKFGYGGLVLGSSQFSILPQLPQKWHWNQKWSKFTWKLLSCFANLNPWHALNSECSSILEWSHRTETKFEFSIIIL